jgi:uncharacterized membrane protein YidH (DUF202 family)
MSWSMYEPISSNHAQGSQMPGMHEQPAMQHKSDYIAQTPQQMPHQLPAQKVQPNQNKNVALPKTAPQKTAWEDISDYHEVADWGFLLVAAILIEILVVAITRFFPAFSGKYLNLWYSRFKLSAILMDVTSVMIGFGIARYIYTEYVYPKNDWNPWFFTGLAIAVQVAHDVLFYIGVIRQVPEGQNGVVDLFKKYADAGGWRVVAGDSAIMAGTSISSMLLKAFPLHGVVFLGLTGAYMLPYFMEARNEFSVLS